MPTKETPLTRQYRQIKAKHPDTVLLFRLGDFYETFGDDAIITAQACGITLTKRNNGSDGDTPLAGFPHHQLDNYLPKLVRAGHRVAVCEQLEDPKQANGIVRRGVVEVVTPGVILYDKLLDTKSHTFLCALTYQPGQGNPGIGNRREGAWGVAFADVSTGTFLAASIPESQIASVLESYQPSEILVNKDEKEKWEPLLKRSAPVAAVTRQEPWFFDVEFATTNTLRHFNTTSLKGFGIVNGSPAAIAAGAIIHYVGETQRNSLPQLRSLRLLNVSDAMLLDQATRRNLEIHTAAHAGESSGALIAILDRTCSPMGGRLLRRWLQVPLVNLEKINARHAAIRAFLLPRQSTSTVPASASIQSDPLALRTELSQLGDLERLITKVVTDRATARDLIALKNGLLQVPAILRMLSPLPALHEFVHGLDEHAEVVHMIAGALQEEAPVQVGTGKMFRHGYNQELDEVRSALTNGQDWIRQYQERERDATGIASLKVAFNNVFGYYIEVSRAQLAHVPTRYERKQTLANAERYTTPDLKQLEQTLLTAEARVSELEAQLLADLKRRVGEHCTHIQQSAMRLAELDCLRAFAEVARDLEYVEPEMHDGTDMHVIGARHPIIERHLPAGQQYVPNDVKLDTEQEQILVITGPNMSGKSSFLRQAGLIVFLAHVGCYVPATHARIPLTDRIFTRVGAKDNIMAGESTFLVEMQEAANIIHNATSRSLILLDEVGRGTATFDGISIAWAIAEYLHEVVGAKTLFATHYHELTALADRFERIHNVKVEVQEVEGGLVFTHRVVPGSADHSFGIHVARMAGMPPSILHTAATILEQLEHGTHDPSRAARTSAVDRHRLEASGQLTMFEVRDDELRSRVKEIDVDALTPLQALQTLAELKETLKD